MSDTAFTAFLGERDETFCITPALIPELERLTGCGIGIFFKRIAEQRFAHADLVNVIRLGLIGGGRTPEDAARIVETYVVGRPILETLPIAISIVEHLWFGGPLVKAIAEAAKGEADAA